MILAYMNENLLSTSHISVIIIINIIADISHMQLLKRKKRKTANYDKVMLCLKTYEENEERKIVKI